MKRKLMVLALSVGCIGVAAAASIATGNLLAVDQSAGTNQQGALFIVDQSSGNRTLFSDFGSSAQGDTGVDPSGVGWMPAGLLGLLGSAEAIVTDSSAGTNGQGALFEVDPVTGYRAQLSDFGNSVQGDVGQDPSGVLVVPGLLGLTAQILVVDPMAGTNGQGAIFSVNSSGSRALLTDFGVGTNQGVYPDSMVYWPGLLGLLGSTILVADGSAGTNGQGELFTVDPGTGTRNVLSDFGNSAQGWVDTNPESTPMSVTISPSGAIYVLVQELSSGGGGAVVQVNPTNGFRTLLTDFGTGSTAQTAIAPNGITWLSSSGLLGVTDADGGPEGNGALLTVNPSTYQVQTLSDFGNANQGALGSDPSGLTLAQ
ncbi:hypothetical protein DyAD56_06725 [Dyella sp. AD56]|uniref:hypothetical protein n=2 Tax=unclassified Dyella TaxID=2634549 RepID=UPI000CABB39C|nr:hypothetical protein [Dyella sp. AD56]PMQ05936.1 hypothetical protein DyAD56_06725 [Dyella sp. AD56]